MRLASLIPVLEWGRHYNRQTFSRDLTAAFVVTMMMIPQSLAYALLAGLPPQLGLFASMLPLLLYAIFGGSGALSVGPFAISSIMTATALATVFPDGSVSDYVAGAVVLALASGLMLVLFGIFKLGFLSNFLSYPVVTGFISASALIIATSQLDNLLGVSASGSNLLQLLQSLWASLSEVEPYTLGIGVISMALLKWLPKGIAKAVLRCGGREFTAQLLAKMTPLLVMVLAIIAVRQLQLTEVVAVVGAVPSGIPTLQLPDWSQLDWTLERWQSLLASAALISLIGYVSALTVAQAFAAKRRQRIDPNREAVGLGLANLGSGVSGAFPISASLSRSAVSFNAGAETPAAGALTALGIALASLFFTDWLYALPLSMLSALVLLAVMSLVNLSAIKGVWSYSRSDFAALALTALLTLLAGVEMGLMSGVILSLLLYLYRSSNPHVAVVGKMPGSEHFRNRLRHQVELNDNLISFRLDASLYFANARFLEDQVNALVAEYPKAKHVVMLCSSISDIDSSALTSLRAVNYSLQSAGIQFHLSEVKGPVMDRLASTDFLDKLTGRVFVSHYDAWQALKSKPVEDYVI